MERAEAHKEHNKFKELCALAQTNSLSDREQVDLDFHLVKCQSCRDLYQEYSMIGLEGMAFLSTEKDLPTEALNWDDRKVRASLFAAIEKDEPRRVVSIITPDRVDEKHLERWQDYRLGQTEANR